LSACQASEHPYLRTIVLVALHTGARKSEILGLTWEDVDFKRERLILRDTKNTETRTVPIKGKALDALREHGKVRRIDTPLLFPGNTLKPADIKRA
jgi:integrase